MTTNQKRKKALLDLQELLRKENNKVLQGDSKVHFIYRNAFVENLSKTFIYENCNTIPKTWKKKKKLGSGSYGNVYEICNGTNCNYAIKEQKNNDSFSEEIRILKNLEYWKHSPKMFAYWSCNKKGYIVEEKLYPFKIKKNQKAAFNLEIHRILDQLYYDFNIIYADVHDGNFLLSKLGEIVVIDFGLSRIFKNENDVFDEDHVLSEPGWRHKLFYPKTGPLTVKMVKRYQDIEAQKYFPV